MTREEIKTHNIIYIINQDFFGWGVDKMFHIFESKLERKTFGGSAFIEIQYCKIKQNTKIKKIVSLHMIQYWKDDSLYIYLDDIEEFYASYKDIFSDGIYNNLKHGNVDLYGINYYSPQQLNEIIDKIEKQKPSDYIVLLRWLKQGTSYNGFYILGI